jgi:hypothetical protein
VDKSKRGGKTSEGKGVTITLFIHFLFAEGQLENATVNGENQLRETRVIWTPKKKGLLKPSHSRNEVEYTIMAYS